MAETKQFHVATVMSVITGRLFAPNGIGDIYLILEHVTGETGIFTHQIPRVMDEIEPFMRSTFPELAAVEVPAKGMDTFEKIFTWFDLNIYDKFGEMIDVPQMPSDDHTSIDPINELKMRYPDKPYIVIGTNEEFEN